MSRRPKRSMKGLSFVFGQIPRLLQTQSQTLTAFSIVLEKPLGTRLPKPPGQPATQGCDAAASHALLSAAFASTHKSRLVPKVIFFVCCFKTSVIAAITVRHWGGASFTCCSECMQRIFCLAWQASHLRANKTGNDLCSRSK